MRIALLTAIVLLPGTTGCSECLQCGDSVELTSVTFQGKPVNLTGDFPVAGNAAPDFRLTATDLSEKSLKDYTGKKVILNIFPSIDTGVCARSVRQFNEKASSLDNTVVLCVSADLPFAQARFCGAEGLKNVVPLSGFRSSAFGKTYGVLIAEGLFQGLYSRAVVVIDETGKIVHSELVEEIANEPDYQTAIDALN